MAKAKETQTAEKTTSYSVAHYSSEGKTQEALTLSESSVASRVTDSMISQVVRVMLSRTHQDTVYAKNRAEVSGGGKKPWKQKGTGRARQGSIRSPQWVGGGVVHGPKGNGRVLLLPKKWSKPVVLELLRKLILTQNLMVVESLTPKETKTKELAGVLKNLPLEGRTLIVVEKPETNLLLSSRNLKNIRVTNFIQLSVLDLLRADKVVVDANTFNTLKKDLEDTNGNK